MSQASAGRYSSSFYSSQPWRGRRSSSGWSRWLVWTPLLVGGVAAAVVAARKREVRDFVKGILGEIHPSVEQLRQQVFGPERDPRLEPVREAIIGNTKRTIVSSFGAPPTAVARPGAGGGVGKAPPTFWQADIWYYPLDAGEQSAMAITFRGGAARDVEFIYPPLGSEGARMTAEG